jgi:hypothetical protein
LPIFKAAGINQALASDSANDCVGPGSSGAQARILGDEVHGMYSRADRTVKLTLIVLDRRPSR